MRQKTLITSALPYANGAIHFGHLAGNNLPADIYARYCRLRGDDVHFICGSDEYGMAVSLSAQMAGRSPQEHVDHFHAINCRLFKQLSMSWDHYSRTTHKGHVAPVQRFFLELLKNGYIEEKWSDQLYSEAENKFLADRYVVGSCPKCGFENARGDECPKCASSYEALELKNPRSKLTGSPLITKATKHWFLRLDLFKDSLHKWLESKSWKPNVVHFIKSYIEELRPRAITRDSDWGIPVPLEGAKGKVLYVWFDAPIGYITGSMEWAELKGEKDLWKNYWLDQKANLVQFMGKDNITFHAVTFPSMIMGQNEPYKLVDEIPANEFYNIEGHKLSKSDGWSVDLDQFLKTYDAESLRYMLAATAPETSDSEFTWKEFQSRTNSELIGKWGNFVHRTLTFLQKMEAVIPPCRELLGADKLFKEQVAAKFNEVAACYSEFKVRRAASHIMELAQICNIYFDTQKPWVLAKKGKSERLETVLHLCLDAIKFLAIASSPIIPHKSQKVYEMIGFKGILEKGNWNLLAQESLEIGKTLPPPSILFNKIEDEVIETEVEKLKAQVKAAKAEELKSDVEPFVTSLCSLEQFQSIDIRCGLIMEAEPVLKSRKLLKLKVDTGHNNCRQIISGIAQHYKPSALVGKRVLCLVNLPKATLMGLESEGMILAASDGKLLELPFLEKIAPGTRLR